MEKRKLDSSKISVIITLAIWNFVFLGTEYLFDNMMAYVADAEDVVIAQSRILGGKCDRLLSVSAFQKTAKGRDKEYPAFCCFFCFCDLYLPDTAKNFLSEHHDCRLPYFCPFRNGRRCDPQKSG